MNKRINIIALLGLLTMMGCTNWLDVKPKVNVEDDEVFKNEQGFKEALTGLYINMSKPTLYGKELTYGFIDILAQRYVPGENVPRFGDENFYQFDVNSDNTVAYTNNFWNDTYNVLSNLNNLLDNIEKNGAVIRTEGYHDLIKGEALGLRGFLYLDLLRMFGPIYKDNPTSLTLPYRTEANRDDKKLLSAKEVAEKIILDLTEAEELLKNDALNIKYESGMQGEIADPFLRRRSKRMNLMAVKATMARAYLWMGEKDKAKQKALEVINAKHEDGSPVFSPVTDNSSDRLLSTELVFALSMDQNTFPNQVRADFLLTQWAWYAAGEKDRLYEMFDVAKDGANDIRLSDRGGFTITSTNTMTKKYEQKNSPGSLNNTMPLIRLAEMYYIASECEDDMELSTKYLNTIRKARGLTTLSTFASPSEKQENIEKEYRKEMYAEGQLWYFYKRLGYETFLFSPVKKMTEKHYRFSLPENEIIYGGFEK